MAAPTLQVVMKTVERKLHFWLVVSSLGEIKGIIAEYSVERISPYNE